MTFLIVLKIEDFINETSFSNIVYLLWFYTECFFSTLKYKFHKNDQYRYRIVYIKYGVRYLFFKNLSFSVDTVDGVIILIVRVAVGQQKNKERDNGKKNRNMGNWRWKKSSF